MVKQKAHVQEVVGSNPAFTIYQMNQKHVTIILVTEIKPGNVTCAVILKTGDFVNENGPTK